MRSAAELNPVLLPKFFALPEPTTTHPLPFPLPDADLAKFYCCESGKQFVAGLKALLEELKTWLTKHAPAAPFNEYGYAKLQRHLQLQAVPAEKILLNFYQTAIPTLWRIRELLLTDSIPLAARVTKLVDVFHAATACESGAANEFNDIEVTLRGFLSFQDALVKLRLDIAQQIAAEIYDNYDVEEEPLGDGMQTHYIRGMLNENAAWFGLPYQLDPQDCDLPILKLLSCRLQIALKQRIDPSFISECLWYGTEHYTGLKPLLEAFYDAVQGADSSVSLMQNYQYFLNRINTQLGPIEDQSFSLADLLNLTDEGLPDWQGETAWERRASIVGWKAEFCLRLALRERLEFAGIISIPPFLPCVPVQSGRYILEWDNFYSARIVMAQERICQPLFTFCIESMFADSQQIPIWANWLSERMAKPYKEEFMFLLMAYTRSNAYRDDVAERGAKQAIQKVVQISEAILQIFNEALYINRDWPISAAAQVAALQIQTNHFHCIKLITGDVFFRALTTLPPRNAILELERLLPIGWECENHLAFSAVHAWTKHLQEDIDKQRGIKALIQWLLYRQMFEYALLILTNKDSVVGGRQIKKLAVLLENSHQYPQNAWNDLISLVATHTQMTRRAVGYLSEAHLSMLLPLLAEHQQSQVHAMVIEAQGSFPSALLKCQGDDYLAWAISHVDAYRQYFLNLQDKFLNRWQEVSEVFGEKWCGHFFNALTQTDFARLAAKHIPKHQLLAKIPVAIRLQVIMHWLKTAPEHFSDNENYALLLRELNPAERLTFMLSIDSNHLKPYRFMEWLPLLTPTSWFDVFKHAGNGLPPMSLQAANDFLKAVPSGQIWPIIKLNPYSLFPSAAISFNNDLKELVELLNRFSAEDIIDCFMHQLRDKRRIFLTPAARKILLSRLDTTQMQELMHQLMRLVPRALTIFNTLDEKVILLRQLPCAVYDQFIRAQGLHPIVGAYSQHSYYVPAWNFSAFFELLAGLQPAQYQALLRLLNFHQHRFCFEYLASYDAHQFTCSHSFRANCLAFLINEQNPPKLDESEFFELLKTIPVDTLLTFLSTLKSRALVQMVLGNKSLRHVLAENDPHCSVLKILAYCQIYENDCCEDLRDYRNVWGGLFGEPSRAVKLAAVQTLKASIIANNPAVIGHNPLLTQALSRGTLRMIVQKISPKPRLGLSTKGQ